MKPVKFEYRRPKTLKETLQLAAEHGQEAAVLAGGQSLTPLLNRRLVRPKLLIDIKQLSSLTRIAVERDRLLIGALARHADVMRSEVVRSHAPLLADALHHVGSPAIRNRGTFGGSLAHADPAAELPACVVCLSADIIAATIGRERKIPADQFFSGAYSTKLAVGEIIVRIEVPLSRQRTISWFDEVARRHGDPAIVGMALAARVEERRIRDCRVVLCGVESTPRRLPAAEACFEGVEIPLDSRTGRAAYNALTEDLRVIGSADYSAIYRLHLVGVLLERATAWMEQFASTDS
jgi:carbon-monoxide dehydrogenase medium subunit